MWFFFWMMLQTPEPLRGAGVGLRPDKYELRLEHPETAVIGELIPCALVLVNREDHNVKVTHAADYRGTGFPTRVIVRAFDPEGQLMPFKERYRVRGGLLCLEDLAPGQELAIRFPLACYVDFKQPGVYTLEVSHDLGWDRPPGQPLPCALATIEIQAPTPTSAEALVGKYMERPWSGFELAQALCVLRDPIYLPELAPYAWSGSEEAIEGLGHLRGLEATRLLIELLRNSDPKIVKAGCYAMLHRIPHWWIGAFNDNYEIEPLLPDAWSDALIPELTIEAQRLMHHPDQKIAGLAKSIMPNPYIIPMPR